MGRQAEAFGGIEQTIGSVPSDLTRQRGNIIGVALVHTRLKVEVLLISSKQFSAITISQPLLPDRRAVIRNACSNAARKRFKSVKVAAQCGNAQLYGSIPPSRIAAAECHQRALFLRSGDNAADQRAFGREEIAVRPTAFKPEALTGVIACTSSQRSRRASLLLNIDRCIFCTVGRGQSTRHGID